jgi:hypothetical protein
MTNMSKYAKTCAEYEVFIMNPPQKKYLKNEK